MIVSHQTSLDSNTKSKDRKISVVTICAVTIWTIFWIIFAIFYFPAYVWNSLRKRSGLPGHETYPGGGLISFGISLFFWIPVITVIIRTFAQ